jgi:hypothetical protein
MLRSSLPDSGINRTFIDAAPNKLRRLPCFDNQAVKVLLNSVKGTSLIPERYYHRIEAAPEDPGCHNPRCAFIW